MIDIYLVEVVPQDIELIRTWRNSELIKSVSKTSEYINEEAHLKWFSQATKDDSFKHWIIMYNNEKVGYASLKHINLTTSSCEFSSLYIGQEEYLGSGIGAVAEFLLLEYIFNTLSLNNVTCEVLGLNNSVILLHKRFGFTVAKVVSISRGSKSIDLYTLSLDKNGWLPKRTKLCKILF